MSHDNTNKPNNPANPVQRTPITSNTKKILPTLKDDESPNKNNENIIRNKSDAIYEANPGKDGNYRSSRYDMQNDTPQRNDDSTELHRSMVRDGFPLRDEDFLAPGQIPIQNDINYTQGYLKTQIGKFVRVEFLLGTNTIVDRSGILKDVGISYIVLRDTFTDTDVLCDIYSIKFVNIFANMPR